MGLDNEDLNKFDFENNLNVKHILDGNEVVHLTYLPYKNIQVCYYLLYILNTVRMVKDGKDVKPQLVPHMESIIRKDHLSIQDYMYKLDYDF